MKNLAVGALLGLVLPIAGLVMGAALITSTGAGLAQATCTTIATSTTPVAVTATDANAEGGVGFTLPPVGTPRLSSLATPAAAIPAQVQAYYTAAADTYHLPWTLLAGIGMEETNHGRNTATSPAGARGLMQFMAPTWARYGVDGDGDGRASIDDPADSVMSAANYLTAAGVTTGGPDGVRRAIFAYNHADWYVNDVLYYAAAYGGGTLSADPAGCGAGGQGNPNLPPINNQKIQTMLTWAQSHVGDPYVFGSSGPATWDCSGFTRAAYAQIGIGLPRTAAAQHDWLAHGNGFQVPYGQEQPGDLIFVDTYLGPNQIGHVMIVFDPAKKLTIEAGGTHVGNYPYTQWTGHHMFSIWRLGTTATTTGTAPTG